MPRPKDLPGNYQLTIRERTSERVMIDTRYQDLNQALKDMRGWLMTTPLAMQWFNVTLVNKDSGIAVQPSAYSA